MNVAEANGLLPSFLSALKEKSAASAASIRRADESDVFDYNEMFYNRSDDTVPPATCRR